MPTKTVAILGATSALGQAVARELLLSHGALRGSLGEKPSEVSDDTAGDISSDSVGEAVGEVSG